MNVPTANVIVAFTKEAMERLFTQGATYKSLVADLSEGQDDVLLFNNVANPNFISFEHSLGLGGGMKMVLSFIDPKNEFEARFFNTNPARLIEGYSNPQAEKTKGFITDKPDDVKQSQKEFSKEFASQYKQELVKTIGEKELYVAYGTGNNLDLWSGPHKVVLRNADITVKGAKKITLTMTPNTADLDIGQRRGAYNETVNLNLQGLKMRYAGNSQEIKFLENITYNPLDYLELQNRAVEDIKLYQKEISDTLKETGFESVADKIEKFDFHAMVVDAIRQYVQRATSNKNVIVLLPNINITCRQAISDAAKTANAEATKLVAAVAAASFGNFKYLRSIDVNNLALTSLGRDEMFVESFLKSLGLRLHQIKKSELSKLEPDAKGHGDISRLLDNERKPTSRLQGEAYYKDHYFTAVIDKTDRAVPDHKQVIQTIFDNIKAASQEYYKPSSLAIMSESDVNVLKLWADGTNKNYPIFAGYDEFTEDSPAIIVGDLALIKEYLYGGVNLDYKFKSIDKLKSAADNYSNDLDFFDYAYQTEEKNVQAQKNAAKSAALAQIPLHPLDRTKLAKKDYNKKIREIVYPVIKGSGSFGDISYLPDHFAYEDEDFSDQEKKYIQENGIPVFRYNTQNPNILDMKFKFGGIYFSTLKMGYQKEISRLASAIAEGILPTGVGSFPIRSTGAAIAYLRSKGFSMGIGDKEKKKVIQDLAGRISPELAEELEVDSEEDAAKAYHTIIEKLEKKNLHGLVLVDQHLPGNPNSILADQAEDMYRKALQMSITTLPTFHISKVASINGPCIVFAQDQDIAQVVRPSRGLMNKFFSGLYKIMGFKHTITTTAASSEFKLVKNSPKFKLEE